MKATSCADALSKVGRRLAPEVRESLPYAVVTNVRAEDDTATAELVGGSSLIRLIHDGDNWLIAGGLNLWTARHLPGQKLKGGTV